LACGAAIARYAVTQGLRRTVAHSDWQRLHHRGVVSVDVGLATELTRSFDSSLPSGMTDALLRAEGVWGHQISATIVHDPVTSSSFL
jgi:hypothetical protein